MRRPGEVLSRLQLLEHAWDFAYENRSNVVDVYVRYLREKVDRPFGGESIETVRGVGYRLREDGGVNRLPIGARLTLVFALAMAVVLALAGSLVYVRVAGDLNTALDQQLRSRAQDVSALVRRRRLAGATSGTLVEHGE